MFVASLVLYGLNVIPMALTSMLTLMASYILTHLMLNSGVTALFRPVVLMVCAATGANPVGPMILLMSSAITVYISPLATPVIPMLTEAGGYNGKSLIKQGLLPSLVLAAVQVFYVMTVFPAF